MNSPQSQDPIVSEQTNISADPLQNERVLVLDFGSQFAQLIARRVRDQNVYCEIVRHDIPAESVIARKPAAMIFSGGPSSVYDQGGELVTRGFVEHHTPQPIESQRASLDVIDHPARCPDDDLHPFGQRLELLLHVLATGYFDHFGRTAFGQLHELAVDLIGQLTRRDQNQGLGQGIDPQRVELFEDGDGKRSGFACPRASLAEDIITLQRMGDHPGLDGAGFGPTDLGQSPLHDRRQG